MPRVLPPPSPLLLPLALQGMARTLLRRNHEIAADNARLRQLLDAQQRREGKPTNGHDGGTAVKR